MKRIINWLLSHQYKTLTAILAVFSAITLGNMTRASIWFDEAFSAYLIRFNFIDIAKYTAADVHPPLYYWLLKVWTMLFGTTELAMRSMSLLFALIGLVGLFVLIRKYFSPKIALLATALASLTPIFIRYTDEARMYTLIFAIIIWATYLLALQQKNPTKKRWVIYGVLVSLGMWTHYFTALAWLAHWVWRYIELRKDSHKQLVKRFFSKSWIWTHALAIGLFLPWMPSMIRQFITIQYGFWIPPFSAYTFIDYLSNGLAYEQYGRLIGWLALLFIVSISLLIILVCKVWKHIPKQFMKYYRLLAVMALAPPVILTILSMPPLKSSFIDRYLMPAMIFSVVFAAITMAFAVRRHKKLTIVTFGAFVALLLFGIGNVYHYGNFNKTTNMTLNMRAVRDEITKSGSFGQPVITATPWMYYEMAFYDSAEHRVYFVDKDVQYIYGSLEMLKQNDIGKIKNLSDFAGRHKYIWYVVQNDSQLPTKEVAGSWKEVTRRTVQDRITNETSYKAVLYDTGAGN